LFCENLHFFVADGKILLSSRKQIICESSLLKQVCDELDVAGKAGLSIAELATQFGLQQYDCRSILKNLCRKGIAVCTLHDHGRTEIQRFVFCA